MKRLIPFCLLLLPSISLAITTDDVYVNCTASCTGDDGTIGNPWCSLDAADAGEARDITAATGTDEKVVLHFSGDCADTTNTFINSGSWVTARSSGNILVLQNDDDNGGVFPTSTHRFAPTAKDGVTIVGCLDVDAINLAIAANSATASYRGLNWYCDSADDRGENTFNAYGNIVKCTGAGATPRGIRATFGNTPGAITADMSGNIAYDCLYNIEIIGTAGSSWTVDHNTLFNATGTSANNFQFTGANSTDTLLFRNNLIKTSVGNDYNISTAAATITETNNFCSDATCPTNSTDSATISFVDEAGDDFHLASGSDGENAGSNLSASIDWDIDDPLGASVRSTTPDVGADERAAAASSVIIFRRRIEE